MKANITLPKCATKAMLKGAKVGSSFIFQGHSTSANSAFSRAGFGFNTNMAWLVLLGRIAPVPVTVVTVTKLPEELT